MSLDASLKSASGLVRHRNVLTRAERLERLLAAGKFTEDQAFVIGLPKVSNRKVSVGKKAAKKPEAAETPAAKAPAKK